MKSDVSESGNEGEVSFIEGCPECRRLSSAYEAATMEWFRLQGQLRIAEYSRDPAASESIVAELTAVSARRQALREAVEKHSLASHPRTTRASG